MINPGKMFSLPEQKTVHLRLFACLTMRLQRGRCHNCFGIEGKVFSSTKARHPAYYCPTPIYRQSQLRAHNRDIAANIDAATRKTTDTHTRSTPPQLLHIQLACRAESNTTGPHNASWKQAAHDHYAGRPIRELQIIGRWSLKREHARLSVSTTAGEVHSAFGA